MTTHANHRIVPPGGQGDARPTARGRSPVASTKIISFVDAEVKAALRRARQELDDEHAATARTLDAARAQATNDLRFVTDNLRHDINTLAAAVNQLRADLDTVAAAVNQLLDDVNQPKQGGVSPELND